VFAAGAVDQKTKQLIAVAVAHVTQCPYCIAGHTKAALRKGASEPEVMEPIWVAAEMRAGGAYAHSLLALETAAHGRADTGRPSRRARPGRHGPPGSRVTLGAPRLTGILARSARSLRTARSARRP
jgi:AhpD family alkylhydroperoxidase